MTLLYLPKAGPTAKIIKIWHGPISRKAGPTALIQGFLEIYDNTEDIKSVENITLSKQCKQKYNAQYNRRVKVSR